MKAYVKKWREIGNRQDGEGTFTATMTAWMKPLCGGGPYEFKEFSHLKNWFSLNGFYWHASWLIPVAKDKQYLLEFE